MLLCIWEVVEFFKNTESEAEEIQEQNTVELIARLDFFFAVVLPLLEKKRHDINLIDIVGEGD